MASLTWEQYIYIASANVSNYQIKKSDLMWLDLKKIEKLNPLSLQPIKLNNIIRKFIHPIIL